jgi:hypothetical protein
VAIIAECFLPACNGVTNSVLRVVEHLERTGHQAMVVAPGLGPSRYLDTPVERVAAVDMPFYQGLSVAAPDGRLRGGNSASKDPGGFHSMATSSSHHDVIQSNASAHTPEATPAMLSAGLR